MDISKIEWPVLENYQFTSGRPATEDDVKRDGAVFVFKGTADEVKPIALELPQYAFYIGESTETVPCVVIQAEQKGNLMMYGARSLEGKNLAGLPKEFKLIGKSVPKKQ